MIQVASEVGYDFEAAFNRAFKREFAVPPGQFRRQFKGQLGRSRARSGVVAGEGPPRIPNQKKRRPLLIPLCPPATFDPLVPIYQ